MVTVVEVSGKEANVVLGEFYPVVSVFELIQKYCLLAILVLTMSCEPSEQEDFQLGVVPQEVPDGHSGNLVLCELWVFHDPTVIFSELVEAELLQFLYCDVTIIMTSLEVRHSLLDQAVLHFICTVVVLARDERCGKEGGGEGGHLPLLMECEWRHCLSGSLLGIFLLSHSVLVFVC